jgi:hypothetical protein
MSILIHLTPGEEASLLDAANVTGLTPDELVRKLITEHLPVADPVREMRRRIRAWQVEDHTPAPPPIAVRSGLTPTASLFQSWADEDANKSDDEVAADDRLWMSFQLGVDEERKNAGMRTVF